MMIRRLNRAADQAFAGIGVALISVVLAAAGFAGSPNGPAAPVTLQGVLIDKESSPRAETRVVSGSEPHLEGGMLWAYTNTRQNLLAPSAQKSGYGIVAYEKDHFIPFDAVGNQKALALLQTTKKQDDMRIEVTGMTEGDKLKVTSIKLLP